MWGASWGPLMQRRMWCHLGSSRSDPSCPFLLCVPTCSTHALLPSVFLGAPPGCCIHPIAWGSLHHRSAPGARWGPGASAGQAEPQGCEAAASADLLLLSVWVASPHRPPHAWCWVPGALDFDTSKFTVIFTLFVFNVLFKKFFLALDQRYLLTCLVLPVGFARCGLHAPTPRAALYPGRAVRVLSRAITSQASVLGNIPVSLCIYDHLS